MRAIGVGILVATLCASSGSLQAGRKAPIVFSPATLKVLREGHAVFGADKTVYVIVPAPVDYVWRLLSDIEHWNVIWGDIEVSRPMGKAGKYSEFAFVTKSPVGKKQYTLVFSMPSEHRLEWFLDKTQPADFRDTRGFWQLEPFDGGQATLVAYRGEYDAWWFPGMMQKRLATSVVEALVRYINQHPHQMAGK